MKKIREIKHINLQRFIPNYNNKKSREISDYLFNDVDNCKHIAGVDDSQIGSSRVD